MKNIIILGNADVKTDYSELVNSADFVIRFNDARNYANNTGVKVDALCVTNLSTPGRLFAKYKTIKKLPFIDNVKEIWFPRPSNYLPFQFWLKPFNSKAFSHADYRKHIIARNNLYEKEIVSFSDELYTACCDELNIDRHSTAHFPSTGYITIKFVLQRFKNQNAKISLIGFSFEGTHCHHWEHEKTNVLALQKNGLIHLCP